MNTTTTETITDDQIRELDRARAIDHDITPALLAQLREAAEKATPGPWTADLDVFDAREGIVACITSPNIDLLAKIKTGLHAPGALDADADADDRPWTAAMSAQWATDNAKALAGQELRDAEYIALVSPSTVLALVAECEVRGTTIAEIAQERDSLKAESEAFATPIDLMKQRIERDTADRIAAWLDDRARNLDGYTEEQSETETIAEELRAGAWRKDAP